MAAVIGAIGTPFVQTAVSSFSTSMSIGTAAADRIVCVALSIEWSSAFTLSTLTINGVSILGTVVEAAHGTTFRKAIIGWGLVTSGTTATIAGSFSGTAINAGDMVMNTVSVTGIGTSPSYFDTLTAQGNGTVASGVIDAVQDGLVLGDVFFNNSGTVTWSGLTEQWDGQSAVSGVRGSGATLIPTANENNRAISSTGSGAAADWCLAAVSFAPDSGAIAGSLAATLGAATLSAAGTLPIQGSTSQSLGALAIASTSKIALNAALSRTLGAVTLAASGSSASAAIAGTLNATLGDVTLSATGAAPQAPVFAGGGGGPSRDYREERAEQDRQRRAINRKKLEGLFRPPVPAAESQVEQSPSEIKPTLKPVVARAIADTILPPPVFDPPPILPDMLPLEPMIWDRRAEQADDDAIMALLLAS